MRLVAGRDTTSGHRFSPSDYAVLLTHSRFVRPDYFATESNLTVRGSLQRLWRHKHKQPDASAQLKISPSLCDAVRGRSGLEISGDGARDSKDTRERDGTPNEFVLLKRSNEEMARIATFLTGIPVIVACQ